MCADSPHIAKPHSNSLKTNDRSEPHIAAFYLALAQVANLEAYSRRPDTLRKLVILQLLCQNY
jgi:hypothetical protein